MTFRGFVNSIKKQAISGVEFRRNRTYCTQVKCNRAEITPNFGTCRELEMRNLNSEHIEFRVVGVGTLRDFADCGLAGSAQHPMILIMRANSRPR